MRVRTAGASGPPAAGSPTRTAYAGGRGAAAPERTAAGAAGGRCSRCCSGDTGAAAVMPLADRASTHGKRHAGRRSLGAGLPPSPHQLPAAAAAEERPCCQQLAVGGGPQPPLSPQPPEEQEQSQTAARPMLAQVGKPFQHGRVRATSLSLSRSRLARGSVPGATTKRGRPLAGGEAAPPRKTPNRLQDGASSSWLQSSGSIAPKSHRPSSTAASAVRFTLFQVNSLEKACRSPAAVDPPIK